MLEVLLSIGAINALIPLIIVLMLIAAAAAITRGFSLFDVFGISSLFGMQSAKRSTLQGKSMAARYGSSRGRLKTGKNIEKAVSARLDIKGYNKNYFKGYLNVSKTGNKSLKTQKKKEVDRLQAALEKAQNSSIPASKATVPASLELENLRKRYPQDAKSVEEERKMKNDIANWSTRAKLVRGTSSPAPKLSGKNVKVMGKDNYTNKFKKAMGSSMDVEHEVNKVGAAVEFAGVYSTRKEYLEKQHSDYEKGVFQQSLASLKDLDASLAAGKISKDEYKKSRDAVLRKFRSESSKYYTEINRPGAFGRRLKMRELKDAGASLANALISYNKGDVKTAESHMEEFYKHIAPIAHYEGKSAWNATSEGAALIDTLNAAVINAGGAAMIGEAGAATIGEQKAKLKTKEMNKQVEETQNQENEPKIEPEEEINKTAIIEGETTVGAEKVKERINKEFTKERTTELNEQKQSEQQAKQHQILKVQKEIKQQAKKTRNEVSNAVTEENEGQTGYQTKVQTGLPTVGSKKAKDSLKRKKKQ
jgi:hypothetical protein